MANRPFNHTRAPTPGNVDRPGVKRQVNKFDLEIPDWDMPIDFGVDIPEWDMPIDFGAGEIPDWDLPIDQGPGNPWENWGGGQGGDGTNGSGDSGSSGFPPWLARIINPNTLSSSGGAIARMLFGGEGENGALGNNPLLSLLGIGGLIGGGVNAHNSVEDAARQMLEANQRTEDLIRGRMEAPSPFQPYTDQGRSSVWQMQTTGPRALAGNFKPLGEGRGMTNGLSATNGRGMTLGKLARVK